MDSRDGRILALLRANARLTYQQLGEGVGLSAAAVYQRVRKLEEAGVILGYHARVAEGGVTVFLRLEPAADDTLRGLLSSWAADRGMVSCHRTVSGTVLVQLRLPSLEDLEPYVLASRSAGCAVHAEVVSATVFEPWSAPAGAGGAALRP